MARRVGSARAEKVASRVEVSDISINLYKYILIVKEIFTRMRRSVADLLGDRAPSVMVRN